MSALKVARGLKAAIGTPDTESGARLVEALQDFIDEETPHRWAVGGLARPCGTVGAEVATTDGDGYVDLRVAGKQYSRRANRTRLADPGTGQTYRMGVGACGQLEAALAAARGRVEAAERRRSDAAHRAEARQC